MTYKDCIYYELCYDKGFSYNENLDEPVETICGNFKDKSKYIELPCKVGNMVYAYCSAVNQIVGYSVEDVHIDNEKTRYFATAFDVYFNEFLDDMEFDEDEIGKTVFLTKSEAEQKLKELIGDS